MVKVISEKEFEQMNMSGLKVVDFSAKWCGPCQMLAPVLEEVSSEFQDKVEFYNVDVDDNPELARQFKIQNIPAIAILKDGNKEDMLIGFQPKDKLVEAIAEKI